MGGGEARGPIFTEVPLYARHPSWMMNLGLEDVRSSAQGQIRVWQVPGLGRIPGISALSFCRLLPLLLSLGVVWPWVSHETSLGFRLLFFNVKRLNQMATQASFLLRIHD